MPPPSHDFLTDADNKSKRRARVWYKTNLMKVLDSAKEKRVRDIDVSIALAKKLLDKLDEPLPKGKEVPLRNVEPSDDIELMKPIESEVTDILYGSTEIGSTNKYLKTRNRKAPEDKFYFRLSSNWDYGWQQRQSRVPVRDVNKGRCAILRDTFYRKNNLKPDPPYYAQPSGGQFSICSEYQCYFN